MNNHHVIQMNEVSSVIWGAPEHVVRAFADNRKDNISTVRDTVFLVLLLDSAPYLDPNQLYNLGRLLRKKENYGR